MLLRYSNEEVDKHKSQCPVGVKDLTREQASINASIFSSKSSFTSSSSFKELLLYFKDLRKQAAVVNRNYSTFKNSKKKVDNIDQNYKWSIVSLAKLEDSIVTLAASIDRWVESDLIKSCENNPENQKCWKTQGDISKFVVSTNKTLSDIESNTNQFISRSKYVSDLLYLDENWKQTGEERGQRMLINSMKPSEKVLLFAEIDEELKPIKSK
jgi:hypothetical protein